jgi:hypothetical protein
MLCEYSWTWRGCNKIDKVCFCQGNLYLFKGTPSQEEHQTGFCIFTTTETALSE